MRNVHQNDVRKLRRAVLFEANIAVNIGQINVLETFIRTESINIAFNKLRFFGVERGNGVKAAVNNAVNACSVRLNGELGCTADKLHSLFGGIYKIQIVFNELVAVRILGIVFGVEHAVEQAAGIFEQNGAFAAAHR